MANTTATLINNNTNEIKTLLVIPFEAAISGRTWYKIISRNVDGEKTWEANRMWKTQKTALKHFNEMVEWYTDLGKFVLK
jgi:hypothetical protein